MANILKKPFVSASIVLYNTSKTDLNKIIESLLAFSGLSRLYLIDNSINNNFEDFSSSIISYIHNPSNPGFGAAHNIGIKKSIAEGGQYHFIVNPDVYFTDNVITKMVEYMDSDLGIGMMMPQVLNEDGTVQNLPKLLPSPYSVFMRKLKRPAALYNNFINKYELRFVSKDRIYSAPILSGCFTLLNLEAIKHVGMYDDSYFMYFEDWDLSRRMHLKYKTVYYPLVSIYHGYESGANKNSKLFKIFLKSAITYFSKWGWFYDKERTRMNKEALSQFK